MVYADGVPEEVEREFRGSTICFEDERVDLSLAARECNLAVTNADHDTTAALLAAGKPMLQFPTVVEGSVTARTVRRLGAGLDAPCTQPHVAVERLRLMLNSDDYGNTASKLAHRFASPDPAAQQRAMVARAEALLGLGPRQPPAHVRNGKPGLADGPIADADASTRQERGLLVTR